MLGVLLKPLFTSTYLFSYFTKCLFHCSFAETTFFAMSTVFSLSGVIDLRQCRRRQLFRLSCFTVLLRRAENVRSEVADAPGNVKYQFYAETPRTEVIEEPKTGKIDWLLRQFCQAGLTIQRKAFFTKKFSSSSFARL